MSGQIVVGIDGSDDSIKAYHWAVEEARLREDEVTAVFAWELPMIGIPGAFDRDELEQSALRFLNEQLDAAGDDDGVTVNRIVAQGDPSASLMEACERLDAEILVLGSRGRGGFKGLLLGSVGQECASHAPCPVLIVNASHSRPS